MTITLCGSTKFKKEFEFWNMVLTFSGHSIFSCAFFGHSDKIDPPRNYKATLDVVHFKKIDLSDAIFVIDQDGYIGESTEREIEYASMNGKTIFYASNEYTVNSLILKERTEWVKSIYDKEKNV